MCHGTVVHTPLVECDRCPRKSLKLGVLSLEGLLAQHVSTFRRSPVSSAGSRDEIRRRYKQAHPGNSARAVSVNVGQLAAFRFDMREGDYVITPTILHELLHYGRVAGPYVSADGDDG